jgi:two-component system response regulator YesN
LYQLLLVDDESSVVETLAYTIPWQEIGITAVHKANSGNEALHILKKCAIDIVITDIRMPGMSGLALIEQIRKKWKRIKCVVLTGYADFDYAREAIVHNASGYLLKPVSDEDIFHTVKTLIATLEQEWEEIISYQRAVQAYSEHLPMLRGQFLKELLLGRKSSNDSLAGKLRTLKIPLSLEDQCAVVLIRIDHYAENDFNSLLLIEYAMTNIVEEIFHEHFTVWHCKDTHDYLVLLVAPNNKQEEADHAEQWQRSLERMSGELQKNVKLFLKVEISILISGFGTFPHDLTMLYQRAIASFFKQIGNEQSLIMTVPEEVTVSGVGTLQSLYEPPLLMHLLEAGRWDAVTEKVENIFTELSHPRANSPEHMLEAFFMIFSSFSNLAHKNGRMLEDVIGEHFGKLMDRSSIRTIQQLREWTFHTLQKFQALVSSEVRDIRQEVVRRVQVYIQEHISEDLSLHAIAEHVSLHPVYLSKIYKLETSENLSDYSFTLRMEKAIYLLKESNCKVYEIGSQLGYQNPAYFIKVFKKQYGKTPQEFREKGFKL